jgi:hypothetical protein
MKLQQFKCHILQAQQAELYVINFVISPLKQSSRVMFLSAC